jgi:predicted  nucleic acid-binding Zn-ribbon protein
MPEYEDFKEIAHCGGQATFHIRCGVDGRRSYSLGFRHSGPGPAALIGIYALAPHGIPVADFQMGGIGQPWDPPCPEGCFPVLLGSDSHELWGHQCPGCSGYFRNGHHSSLYPLTCPYCGLRDQAYQFLTDAQRAYVRHYVSTLLGGLDKLEPGTERKLVIDMDAVVDQAADQPKPDFYYATETQQTRYSCVKCGDFNDIRGRYGYCASCGWRNNMATLKTSFTALRESLNGGHLSPDATVRSAVSEFDACCRDIVVQLTRKIPLKPSRRSDLERLVFHDVDSPTISALKSMFDIDLLRGLDDEIRFVKLMMHRRHLYEHNAGVADERYVRMSGDPDAREGVLVRETQANVHRLLSDLTRMAENLESDFHEIFPPTECPMNYHLQRQELMRQS